MTKINNIQIDDDLAAMDTREMYNSGIKLTAYKEDTEPRRKARLERIIGYVCALADQNGDDEVLSLVAGLHDHKGDLTVTWKDKPSRKRRRYFVAAWESVIGDGARNVEHDCPAPWETADESGPSQS